MSEMKAEDEIGMPVQVSLLGVAARDIKRLQIVFKIIARHGFGELFLRSAIGKLFFSDVPLDGSPSKQLPAALRFRRLLEELGPTCNKFSGRPLVAALSRLHQTFLQCLPLEKIELQIINILMPFA